MNKKIIKKLAKTSYSSKNLNKKRVMRIVNALKREDLKTYIRDLKQMEAKNTVTVTLPSDEGLGEIKNLLSKLYPGKKIVVNLDESMLTGIKVVDYDNVYELSLKNFLQHAVRESTND